jgi:hypothetical protein
LTGTGYLLKCVQRPGERMRAQGIILVWALAAALAGCQSETANYRTERMPTGDYDRAFEVTRQVLGEKFAIEQADKASGRIVTSSQAANDGSELGMPLLSGSGVKGVRRTATAQVKSASGTVMVSVKVQLQRAEAVQASPRPTYSEYDATTTGPETGRYVQPEEKTQVTWRMVGSDVEMERRLLAEIESRLKAAGVEVETPKEAPAKSE